MAMAGLVGMGSPHNQGDKTPLIPDAVFCALFERAHRIVGSGKELLDLRDDLDSIAARLKKQTKWTVRAVKSSHLADQGWVGGLDAFNRALVELRTACYIVLASTSGCRNHELANVQSNAHLRTQDDKGTVYHWMRSRSDKTDAGIHDWMIPETSVRALRIMERWAEPYQSMIAVELAELRRANPHDPQITEAQKHRQTLFLGVSLKKGNQARALSLGAHERSRLDFRVAICSDRPRTQHRMLRDGGIDGLLDYSNSLFCERNCLCFLTVGSLRQLASHCCLP